MIRAFVASALLISCAGASAAAEQSQLDASPSLFSVLAAVNAAGYDADLNSPANSPLRELVRKQLASRNIPVLDELKRFFAAHRQKDWTAELSQYVSFALSVSGPPNFKYRFLSNQLPPDVAPLAGFEELMVRFHKEAGIDQLWNEAQPYYEQALARYHGPAAKALLEVNAYLRNTASGFLGRHFQVYVDLLGAPNQIQTRSYADDYFVVVTPSAEPQAEDIRHAYLHYMMDPLAGKDSELVNKKKSLSDFAQGAPALESYYKEDFLLLVTESLIKAVESRLTRQPALVEQALREGFILTPYFAEALPSYERQEQSMRFFFPELINGIDLRKETQRLDKVEFAKERAVRKAKVVPAERKIEPAGAYKTMEEAEQFYTASREADDPQSRNANLDKAGEAYRRVLQETADKALHAKSYYGLARIAAMRNDPETAQKLFEKTLEASPDPQTRAWALVYLGRLADAQSDRDAAVRHYRAALAIEAAPAGARKAAEQGVREAFGKQGKQN